MTELTEPMTIVWGPDLSEQRHQPRARGRRHHREQRGPVQTRARCHSSLLCVTLIGILHVNENEGGIMTEGPRLSGPLLDRRRDRSEVVVRLHDARLPGPETAVFGA